MKHTLFSRTVQIACVKTHAILRTRPMRFNACVIFDAIIRSETTQRILSESTLRQQRPDGRMLDSEPSEQRGHHEKPTGDIVDRLLSQQDGTIPSGIPAQHRKSSDGP